MPSVQQTTDVVLTAGEPNNTSTWARLRLKVGLLSAGGPERLTAGEQDALTAGEPDPITAVEPIQPKSEHA